jgi:DNA polymerase-1
LERFSKVAEFMASTIEQAKEQGYVTTLFGRRRQIPELRARNYQVRTLGERLAVNTVIQGTAADVMKLAMIGTHRALAESGLQTRIILTIHDELLLEGPAEETEAVKAILEREMLAPWGDRVPPLAIDVGTGHTWMDAK